MKLNKINIIMDNKFNCNCYSAIILIGDKIIDFELSDIKIRMLVILELLAIPILAFSTIKKFKIK